MRSSFIHSISNQPTTTAITTTTATAAATTFWKGHHHVRNLTLREQTFYEGREGRKEGSLGVNFTNILCAAFFLKVLRKAFLCLQLRLNVLLAQEYWRKCDHKMLVKLTLDLKTCLQEKKVKLYPPSFDQLWLRAKSNLKS